MPLPLLCRQHQDRFPGCDRQESTASRQSQLKTLETGLPLFSRPTSPSRIEAGDGRSLDSLKRLCESDCGRVWLLFLTISGLTKQGVEVKLTEFKHRKQMKCTTCCWTHLLFGRQILSLSFNFAFAVIFLESHKETKMYLTRISHQLCST